MTYHADDTSPRAALLSEPQSGQGSIMVSNVTGNHCARSDQQKGIKPIDVPKLNARNEPTEFAHKLADGSPARRGCCDGRY